MGKCYLNIVAYPVLVMVIGHHTDAAFACFPQTVKAKFHYASWFGAGSELVRSWFNAKFHYAIWFEQA